MIELNVGCTDIDALAALNEKYGEVKVTTIYGSSPLLTQSARSSDRLKGNESLTSRKKLADTVQKAADVDIAIRYTINQACLGAMEDFSASYRLLVGNLKFFEEIGIEQFTVCSPLILEIIKDTLPRVSVEVSTIAEVDNLEKIYRWKKLGANGVCLSLDSNRSLKFIEKAANMFPTIEFELLANEFCLFRCPWRRDCYNLSSHNSIRGPFNGYPFARCYERRQKYPVEWIKSRFILPQWMKLYEGEIKMFKITGRTHPSSVTLPIIEEYMKESHLGNLLDLWPSISQLAGGKQPESSCLYLDSNAIAQKYPELYIEGRCSDNWVSWDGFTGLCSDCGVCKEVFDEVYVPPENSIRGI